MKSKVNLNLNKTLPCIMYNDFLESYFYVSYIKYPSDEDVKHGNKYTIMGISGDSLGMCWNKSDLKGYCFLPKGLSITFTN